MVITGDSHNAWASNLYRQMVRFTPNGTVTNQGPALGVEFATGVWRMHSHKEGQALLHGELYACHPGL